MKPKAGFAVIYRWRLRAGSELAFREAWQRGTQAIAAQRGGLGSRLHQAEDGSWLAYAQWPSREAWEQSRMLGSVNSADSALMQAAAIETDEPILLVIESDLLGTGPLD